MWRVAGSSQACCARAQQASRTAIHQHVAIRSPPQLTEHHLHAIDESFSCGSLGAEQNRTEHPARLARVGLQAECLDILAWQQASPSLRSELLRPSDTSKIVPVARN